MEKAYGMGVGLALFKIIITWERKTQEINRSLLSLKIARKWEIFITSAWTKTSCRRSKNVPVE
jgi:hypothetical protein